MVEAVIRDLTGETAIDKGVGEDERTDDAGGLVFVWKEKERERWSYVYFYNHDLPDS